MAWRVGIVGLVLLVVVVSLIVLNDDTCPDAEDGKHHDLFCFRDNEFGRVTFYRCLYCLRATPGIESPWIRRRT